jgi:glutamate dehydrogenase (NAD(P)+)
MALGTAVGIRETAASSIRSYFEMAADRLGLHPEMRRLLSVPFRELTVELPLRRDDQRLQLFRGYRVQHNGVRGPVIGPTRLQAGLDLETLRSLAESMTWRCAVANVPFGGAAGGVACEPAQLSSRELEQLMRRYASRMHQVLGIYQDICSPDANAGPEVMEWIADEYSSLHKDAPATTVGRPSESGGLPDRDAIIGRALAALIVHVAHDQEKSISGLRVVVQSLDQSAIHTARALAQSGCVVLGIAEERGAAYSQTGLDVEKAILQLELEGTIADSEGRVVASEMYKLDCDVLTIADTECALNSTSAGQVRAKVVIEASELVVSPLAERNLANRGVFVVPDLVGAAAPVLAANAEWSSNAQKVSASSESVEHEITRSLIRIYEQVVARSQQENLSLRSAAYCAGIEKVARSERLRVA